jgi:catalase
LIADGIDRKAAFEIHREITVQGATARFISIKLGRVKSAHGAPVDVETTMETMPAVLWDGLVILDGESATDMLAQNGRALEFLKDQYRHSKTILLLGSARDLLEKAGIPSALDSGDDDPGLLKYNADNTTDAVANFTEALSKHRHFSRETDPPLV